MVIVDKLIKSGQEGGRGARELLQAENRTLKRSTNILRKLALAINSRKKEKAVIFLKLNP